MPVAPDQTTQALSPRVREERLTHVPAANLEAVTESFKIDGAVQVRRTLESDGSWTVSAIFVD